MNHFTMNEDSEYFLLHEELEDYDYIHYYIITDSSKDKVERDIIEIEIDGKKVCRMPLLVLCTNYLFLERKAFDIRKVMKR